MSKNLGDVDRGLRVLGALAAAMCAVNGPFSLPIRLLAFGGASLYLLVTALAGSCVGYRLLGKSTCPSRERA
jgi:hypothetical protein